MSSIDDDRPTVVPGMMGALRDGWHGLGGGDAERCPGCPVCRLSESAGRLDPATGEHLQAAVGHLVSAGRELLAALSGAEASVEEPNAGPPRHAPGPTSSVPTSSDPGPARTRIPVSTDTASPDQGDEEQA